MTQESLNKQRLITLIILISSFIMEIILLISIFIFHNEGAITPLLWVSLILLPSFLYFICLKSMEFPFTSSSSTNEDFNKLFVNLESQYNNYLTNSDAPQNLLSGYFKHHFIAGIIKNFFDDVNYIPDKAMPHEIYAEGKYLDNYNRYFSDDYFEAKINNTYNIKMAEVQTVLQYDRTSTPPPVFHGLFAKIELHQSILSELTIKPNNFVLEQKLNLDSIEFENLFDVTTTNKIIAMQILTADVMDFLVSLFNKDHIPFDISIYDNYLYIRLHATALFEIDSFNRAFMNKKNLEFYYRILDLSYNLSTYMINVIEHTEI